ncbi:hypothetical protein F5Y15DRAFT_122066 [Xylariaceae sp. FL0016]|nr:hypothetical protein F5Y15DRAFT_122066 [Xylariaceae sp. FL0016]
MQRILGKQGDRWPYAASSTGPYRGLLVRKYPCWDAQGPAREVFMTDIAGKIKDCLEKCLPESNSFVGFSLFMVGKTPEKTKPYVMIVSDDKSRRKEAFHIVKSRNVVSQYPGFELGHCSLAAEFEDLRQLGDYPGDSREMPRNLMTDQVMAELLSSEACTEQNPNWSEPNLIHFHTPAGGQLGSATSGGIFSHRGQVYLLTVAHALFQSLGPDTEVKSSEQSSSSGDDSDYEMTGLDDWDDSEDGNEGTITSMTSPGSRTPSEQSDNEDSQLGRCDSHRSSEVSLQLGHVNRSFVLSPPITEFESTPVATPESCERIGPVVSLDHELDLILVKVQTPMSGSIQSLKSILDDVESTSSISKAAVVENSLSDSSVIVKTTHHTNISGRRSTTSYTRLPNTEEFQMLHSVRLNTPLHAGDSGSWVFSKASGKLIGFVVAGSPKTGLCLVTPAQIALASMLRLLQKGQPVPKPSDPIYIPPKQPISSGISSGISLAKWASPGIPSAHTAEDDDAATVASSRRPPSVFSSRFTYASTASVDSFSVQETSFVGDHLPPYPNAEGDFLKEHNTQLRRELERAWEIIHEKDERLSKYFEDHPESTSDSESPHRASPQAPGIESLSAQTWTPEDQEIAKEKLDQLRRRVMALKNELDTKDEQLRRAENLWKTQVNNNQDLVQENRALKSQLQAMRSVEQDALYRRSVSSVVPTANVSSRRGRPASYYGQSKSAIVSDPQDARYRMPPPPMITTATTSSSSRGRPVSYYGQSKSTIVSDPRDIPPGSPPFPHPDTIASSNNFTVAPDTSWVTRAKKSNQRPTSYYGQSTAATPTYAPTASNPYAKRPGRPSSLPESALQKIEIRRSSRDTPAFISDSGDGAITIRADETATVEIDGVKLQLKGGEITIQIQDEMMRSPWPHPAPPTTPMPYAIPLSPPQSSSPPPDRREPLAIDLTGERPRSSVEISESSRSSRPAARRRSSVAPKTRDKRTSFTFEANRQLHDLREEGVEDPAYSYEHSTRQESPKIFPP